jgi:hypothetical protein
MGELAVRYLELKAALLYAREEYKAAVEHLDTLPDDLLRHYRHPFSVSQAYQEVWQAELDLEAFEREYRGVL